MSSEIGGGASRHFQVFTALDFLVEVTQHIPEKGEHLVLYYGWYSHRRHDPRVGADEGYAAFQDGERL